MEIFLLSIERAYSFFPLVIFFTSFFLTPDEYMGVFQSFVFTNNAAINTLVHTSFHTFTSKYKTLPIKLSLNNDVEPLNLSAIM